MTKQNKTTIHGIPMAFSQEELEQRQQQAVKAYTETSQSLHRVAAPSMYDLLNKFQVLVLKGYSMGWIRPERHGNHNVLLLAKPQEILDKELADIKYKVKLSYEAELQLSHIDYQELLIQQMLEQDEAKEDKKLADKKARRLAEIREIAAATYTPLQLPTGGNLHL